MDGYENHSYENCWCAQEMWKIKVSGGLRKAGWPTPNRWEKGKVEEDDMYTYVLVSAIQFFFTIPSKQF